jgi:hypothetical protein
MIARHEAQLDKTDIWSALAAPLPAGVISWRQDGRAVLRDGKFYARFLAYIDANTVRERLDAIVPGEWDLTLELLPALPVADDEARADQSASFKARLQILGVIREDVGTGRDYKSAATDAFKRAAVRFGIGHELYAMDQNWVQVDGESRHAKPLEDPQSAYDRRPAGGRVELRATAAARRNGRNGTATALPVETPVEVTESIEPSPVAAAAVATLDADAVACPKCGGRMWDNRLSKRNPKAPDFKCRDRGCDGVVWPPRDSKGRAPAAAGQEPAEVSLDSSPLAGDDDIPF